MRTIALILLIISIKVLVAQEAFPFILPKEKPKRELSAAMHRNYDAYLAPRPEHNELFSQFKYTELKGFDYNNYDGTISRRDPSKVIFENGKYYVWYTYRHTSTKPIGMNRADEANDTLATADWNLSEIWYATSTDGFNWDEQGVAVPRPPKPNVGWRSVTTTDILIWKGKYYLYYQGFMEASGKRGDDCPVTVSYADSPDGPWIPYNKVVVENGEEGEWDQYSIHDPHPFVYKNKIYLYYKSDFDGDPSLVRMSGLAIADDPLGPFEKHPLNPVINSGHETVMFPFKGGIAAMVLKDGNEHFTIQFAPDGVNFEIASIVEDMPGAPGPYVPDAFNSNGNGRGITWGISHLSPAYSWQHKMSILMRFDCDLNLDVHDPEMKHHENYRMNPEDYYKKSLSKKQRERISKENKKLKDK